jgi:hypothetical protein
LGRGANLAKQLAAINNTGRELTNVSIVDLITQPAASDATYQLNHDPDHHDPKHADLDR